MSKFSAVKSRGNTTVVAVINRDGTSRCTVKRYGEELWHFLGREGNHAHDRMRREADILMNVEEEGVTQLGCDISAMLDEIQDELDRQYYDSKE